MADSSIYLERIDIEEVGLKKNNACVCAAVTTKKRVSDFSQSQVLNYLLMWRACSYEYAVLLVLMWVGTFSKGYTI